MYGLFESPMHGFPLGWFKIIETKKEQCCPFSHTSLTFKNSQKLLERCNIIRVLFSSSDHADKNER